MKEKSASGLTRAGFLRAAAGAAALPVLGRAARAASGTLRWGIGSEPSSIDPHFQRVGPNQALSRHIFDALVEKDPNLRDRPSLAESWRTLDELTWEFRLRPEARFHDGTPVTAEDVRFSIERVPLVPNSPSSFTVHTQQIRRMEIVDPHTIRLITDTPFPLMPTSMSEVCIVSRRAADGATTADFNAGRAAIGSGPYRFAEWRRGDRVILRANDEYWGRKPAFAEVDYRVLRVGPARLAALLAGDVDLIENPPSGDVERLRRDARLAVTSVVSYRLIYLAMDQYRQTTPGVEGDRNPFLDPRVRRAVSIAINRRGIAERVMEGQATPASQILSPALLGYDEGIAVPPYDVAAARQLLAEAGFPNGFAVTFATTNDRYVNDARVAQAIAANLTQVGIRVTVDAMPGNVYFARRARGEFSLFLGGFGSGSGEASHGLRVLIATRDEATGLGPSNEGQYSNARVDALLAEGLRTIDQDRRVDLFRQATRIAMAETAIVPVHWEHSIWAARRGVTFPGRLDQYNLAMEVSTER